MTVESVTTPQDLNVAYPAAGDDLSEGDDHLRNEKIAIKKMGWEHVGTMSASASASLNTASGIAAMAANYDYMMVGHGFYCSAAATLHVQFTNSGTADAGSNYSYSGSSANTTAATVAYYGAHNSASIQNFGSSMGDANTETGGFELEIIKPADASLYKEFCGWSSSVANGGGSINSLQARGVYKSATAVDGFYVTPSAGNITAGTINLYRRYRPG